MIIRCKSCGRNIQYDIALQKLHCGHCGSNFAPEDYPDESPTFTAASYICQSCGAKLISTEDTEATAFCSYCGSTSILTGRMEKIKKPDEILPFRITREECREIYLKQAKRSFLSPRWLRSTECTNSFRPIYMPYWSYRIDAQGHVAKYETSKEKDGSYLVETTTHYRSDDFDRSVGVWSHDASKAFADDISEMMAFHEVDEKEFKPFHEGYLSGFYADLADDTAQSHKRIAEDEMKARLGGSDRRFIGKISIKEHKLKYMPVWFMSTKNKNRITYAAVNGYTGKIVADFPISTLGFLAVAGVLAVILAALLSLVLVLRPEPAFWCAAGLTLIGLIFCSKEETRLHDMAMETGFSLSKNTYELGGKTSLASIFILLAMILCFVFLFIKPVLTAIVAIITFYICAAVYKTEINIPMYTFSKQIFVSFVLCLLSGLLLMTRDNMVIYSTVLFNAFILSFNCIRVFRIHQHLATRRPPQFNRKGSKYDA